MDFNIAVRERQAVWGRANNDFTRAEDLVSKGSISRRDYDLVEANFKTAAAALDAAKLSLQYTQLTAPFDGNAPRPVCLPRPIAPPSPALIRQA